MTLYVGELDLALRWKFRFQKWHGEEIDTVYEIRRLDR